MSYFYLSMLPMLRTKKCELELELVPYKSFFIVCVCENQWYIQCWLLWTLVVT